MARNKGTFKFAANLEVQSAAALDPRVVVDTKAELINKETWPYDGDTLYLYEGLVVAVRADKSIFMLIDKSKVLSADYSGWKQLDVSAAVSVEIIDGLTSQASNAALSANQGYKLKQEIDALGAKLSSVYSYKGTKATYAALAAVEDPALGDVWNVEEAHNGVPAGTNYAWNGTEWDALGGAIDLSKYYTKEELDEKFVPVNEDGNTSLKGNLVSEDQEGTKTTIARIGGNHTVVIGDEIRPLELIGVNERPSYSTDEAKNEIALLTDVQEGDSATLDDAKAYTDSEIAALNVGNLVEKEDGKELIPTNKLALIDTNASDIETLRTDLDALTDTVDGLVDSAAKLNVDSVLTGVGAAKATATSVELEFGKADATNNEFSAVEAAKVNIPVASTSQAGVMTATDKTTLNTVASTVTSLNSTTDFLTTAVNTLNGDDSTTGSVRNIAKDEAAKAVAGGMEWIEIAPEPED